MYIFWFLHQTTTLERVSKNVMKLYIFWFLHQTTTRAVVARNQHPLYIFWFLHQTTTTIRWILWIFELYIFWFLHQTTTFCRSMTKNHCCISFDSYIKPQPADASMKISAVVYLLIPTSNHNVEYIVKYGKMLYIFWFLHQTTTQNHQNILNQRLYIFWFLHQTTTIRENIQYYFGCISFDSYIKPQHIMVLWLRVRSCISFDSYIKPQREGVKEGDNIVGSLAKACG